MVPLKARRTFGVKPRGTHLVLQAAVLPLGVLPDDHYVDVPVAGLDPGE